MGHRVLSGKQQTFLDCYRVLAALFVLVGHSFSFYQATVFKDQQYFPYLQNIGVVMLFLLSGFLMAHSISKKNENHDYTLAKSAKHKIKRIYSEYIPGLIFIVLLDRLAISLNGPHYFFYHTHKIKNFISCFFMLQDRYINTFFAQPGLTYFGSGAPLWTLSVDWWLYFLFAGFYLLLANKEKIDLKKILVLAFLIIMPLDCIIGGRGGGLGLVFGLGFLAYVLFDRINLVPAVVLFCVSIILYIHYGTIHKEAYSIQSFLILWVMFCSGIRICSGSPGRLSVRNKFFAYLSKSAFMLYLIHYSIIDMLATTTRWQNTHIKFAAGILISGLLSLIMYYIFGEKQLMYALFRKKETHKRTKTGNST